jgi:hypothetical protein
MSQINALADRIRALRRDTVANSSRIKALTSDLAARWVDLRVLRAPTIRADVALTEGRRTPVPCVGVRTSGEPRRVGRDLTPARDLQQGR